MPQTSLSCLLALSAATLVSTPALAGIAYSREPGVRAGHFTNGDQYSTATGLSGAEELDQFSFDNTSTSYCYRRLPCKLLNTYEALCNWEALPGKNNGTLCLFGGGPGRDGRYRMSCNINEVASGGECRCPPPSELFLQPNNPPGSLRKCGPVVVIDKTKKRPNTCYGNPISPLVGAKRESVSTGLVLGGLEWVLTYDSNAVAVPTNGAATANNGAPAVGNLWFSNLHRRLDQVLPDPSSLSSARAYRGDGAVFSFPTNAFSTNDRDVTDILYGPVDGERLYVDSKDLGLEAYDDMSGGLKRIDFVDGRTLKFTYSTDALKAPAPGYLIRVEDQFGRALDFEYELPPGSPAATGGLLTRALRSGTVVAALTYNSNAMLTDITWADGSRRSFHYEDMRSFGALTGVTDERRVRVSTFGYDSAGRAVSTEHAGGVNRFSVTYDAPPHIEMSEVIDSDKITRTYFWVAPTNPVVTYPDGTSSQLGVTTLFGQPLVTSRSQPAGAGCSASTSAVAYDSAANVTSEDDFNGHRTCVVSDGSRETRVEGLPAGTVCSTVTSYNAVLPRGARSITKDFMNLGAQTKVVTRIAEPNRMTNIVYNGQPDPTRGYAVTWCAPSRLRFSGPAPLTVICRRVERATTDVTGTRSFNPIIDSRIPARVWAYTYNAAGQVLTEDGPRTDVADVTTFEYFGDTTASHTRGDLAKRTTATGEVTTYVAYDGVGRLLSEVDSNGVVRRSTYDARGRLLSDPLGTQYGYDKRGALDLMSTADQSSRSMKYDAAGRVTAIVDGAGNTLEFTNDARNNPTRIEVKNALGTSVRLTTQQFDALGRLQRTTGEQAQ